MSVKGFDLKHYTNKVYIVICSIPYTMDNEVYIVGVYKYKFRAEKYIESILNTDDKEYRIETHEVK